MNQCKYLKNHGHGHCLVYMVGMVGAGGPQHWDRAEAVPGLCQRLKREFGRTNFVFFDNNLNVGLESEIEGKVKKRTEMSVI